MTELIIFLAIVILVATVIAALREVLHDGYGHSVPPKRFKDLDPFNAHPAS